VTRVLIDTSIYVDWFRARRHEEIVAGRRGPPSLSAIVAMDLLVGERGHERLLRWTARFERTRRLLVPGWPVWVLAARVMRRLRRQGVADQALTNDVLIAMTARIGGLRLFTTNREHFERIASVEPFDLVVVS
jgi:predicted nucleic acid-binding protein